MLPADGADRIEWVAFTPPVRCSTARAAGSVQEVRGFKASAGHDDTGEACLTSQSVHFIHAEGNDSWKPSLRWACLSLEGGLQRLFHSSWKLCM